MSFSFEPSVLRLPDEVHDRSGWSDADRFHCGFVHRNMTAALESIRRWGHADVRHVRTAEDLASFTTEDFKIRCSVERGLPTPVVKVAVESNAGTSAAIEYPVLAVDFGDADPLELPDLAEQAILHAVAQLEAVSLMFNDGRWKAADAAISMHLKTLLASGQLEHFDNPQALVAFPDGAHALVMQVYDLFDDDCGTIEFSCRNGRPVCPSPGHARMLHFSQQSNVDGTAFIHADITSPRTSVTPDEISEDPIDLIRTLRGIQIDELAKVTK